MNDINFIFLRSRVGNNEEFLNQERSRFIDVFNEDNYFKIGPTGRDIFFIETGGAEEQFKAIFASYKEPYFLLATDANNSLPACLEIATFLDNLGKEFYLIHGTPEEISFQLKTENFSKKCGKSLELKPIKMLENKRYGVIGKPSDWLIASDVNYEQAKETFGATIIDISSEELLTEISAAKLAIDSSKFYQFENNSVSRNCIDGAIKIYTAILALINRYELDGITIRCFDLLSSVKNTSCLALALLNKDGYIATCEGDIPAMLTMALIRELYSQSSFQVNPSYINIEKKIGYFAHCTLPIDMCEKFSFDTHFESGIGVGIKGDLRLSKVTIFKINKNLKKFELFEGNIVENLKKPNLCRTQIKVAFDEDIDDILSSPNGNHLILFYGSHKQDIIGKFSS